MGLERMFSKNTYICESINLDKRWVVQAKDIEDATGVVLTACKEHLKCLESMRPDEDIDVDLRFTLVEDGVLEL